MMSGNPNWWSMHPESSQHHQLSNNNDSQNQFVYGSSNIIAAASVDNLNQDFPLRSWSQLLLGVGRGDQDRYGDKFENWEIEQVSSLNYYSSQTRPVRSIHVVDHVKQEQLLQPITCQLYDEVIHKNDTSIGWSPQQNLSNGFLNFSGGKLVQVKYQHQHQRNQDDQSSECNSTNTCEISKKARVQQSSSQPALQLKVRKEKLGDRITALHQLVSPFGKTDTASVLSEAIVYIRFLQTQVEALSTPYIRNARPSSHHQHSRQGELTSRGLCLVPISCTQNVGNDTSNDYWAPAAAFGRGF